MAPSNPLGLKTKAVKKRKHNSLTIAQKLDISKRLQKGERVAALMKEFDVGQSTIYDCKYKSQKLETFAASAQSTKFLEKIKAIKKPIHEDLDEVLYRWFCDRRAEGVPISGLTIQEKGKQLAQDMNIKTEVTFSDGWLRCFKERHGIRDISVCGEKKSADHESAAEFSSTFHELVKKYNLTPDQIYNADETGLYWRSLPTRTLAGSGEKQANGFKMNKQRVTLLLCANASGRHRMKMFVVGKYKKPRALKGVTSLPVIYDAQKSAWMNAALFKDWFFKHFVPGVKAHFLKIGLPEDSKCVLLLDNCRAHPPAHELVSGSIFVAYLPANVTSLIQPMDQGVCQNVKSIYKKSFCRKMITSDLPVADFQQSFSIKDAIFHAAMAWDEVKEVTLQRCWRKLYNDKLNVVDYQFVEDDCEDDFDEDNFEGFGEDLSVVTTIQKIKNIMAETKIDLDEADIDEWLAQDAELGGVEMMSDKDIIDSVVTPDKEKEDEDDEEESEEVQQLSWSEGVAAMERVLLFAERSPAFNISEVMNLHILMKEFYKKRSEAVKQADIRDLFKRAAKRARPTTPDSKPSTSTQDNPRPLFLQTPASGPSTDTESADDPQAI